MHNQTPNEDIEIKDGKLSDITPEQFGQLCAEEQERRFMKWYKNLNIIEQKEVQEEMAKADGSIDFAGSWELEYRNQIAENKLFCDLLDILTDEDFLQIAGGNKNGAATLKELAKNKDITFFAYVSAYELLGLLWAHSAELKGHKPQLLEIAEPAIRHEIGTGVREKDFFELLAVANDPTKLTRFLERLNSERNVSATHKTYETQETLEDGQSKITGRIEITIKRKSAPYTKNGKKVEKLTEEKIILPYFPIKPQLATLIEAEAMHAVRDGRKYVYISDARLRDLGIYTGKDRTGKALQTARKALQIIAEPLSKISININDSDDVQINVGSLFSTVFFGSKERAKELGYPGRGLRINVSKVGEFLTTNKTFDLPEKTYSLEDAPFIIAKMAFTQIRNNPQSKEHVITIGHVLRNIDAPSIETLKANKSSSRQVSYIEGYLKKINALNIGLYLELVGDNKKPLEILTNGRIKIMINEDAAKKYKLAAKTPKRKAKKIEAKNKAATMPEQPAGEWISTGEDTTPLLKIDD